MLYVRDVPNPALELADTLQDWATVPGNKSIVDTRGGLQHYRANQARAAGLYSEVLRALATLEMHEDVEHWRAFTWMWWDAVFLPNEAWNTFTSSARQLISAQTIASLRGLGMYLAKTHLQPMAVAPEALATSKSALAEALSVLKSAEVQLDGPLREYVFTLINQVQGLLDREDHGVTIDLLSRINELRGALDDIADRLERAHPSSETSGLLRAAARRIMPVVVRGAVSVGFALDAAANVHELTTGH